MKILITCGPSYEPIDGARRMTNMSTGKLGATLADRLAESGHEVICLKGEGSTHPGPMNAGRVIPFSTNDDLAEKLAALAGGEPVDVVLHAAALCDYRVEEVRNDSGEALCSRKFATRSGRLHVILAPATKVLPKLRGWFPGALILGWKYELTGSRDDAFDKAWRQIREGATDACVLNGSAYGEGFALCRRDGVVESVADAAALCCAIESFMERRHARMEPGELASRKSL